MSWIFLNIGGENDKHVPKRTYTEQYDDLNDPVLRSYFTVSYTEKDGDLRRKNARILSSYMKAVYSHRFAPYIIVILDHVIWQNTVVYGVRIRRPGFPQLSERKLWLMIQKKMCIDRKLTTACPSVTKSRFRMSCSRLLKRC